MTQLPQLHDFQRLPSYDFKWEYHSRSYRFITFFVYITSLDVFIDILDRIL